MRLQKKDKKRKAEEEPKEAEAEAEEAPKKKKVGGRVCWVVLRCPRPHFLPACLFACMAALTQLHAFCAPQKKVAEEDGEAEEKKEKKEKKKKVSLGLC